MNRDLAHNFQRVAEMVAGRLEDELWPDLAAILKREGINQYDLGAACESFCIFVGSSFERPEEDMTQALERCGWMQLKPGAQVAVMACLGTVVLGMHFAGVREATLGGEGPAMSLKALHDYGKQSSALITESRWARRIRRWRLKISSVWYAMMGRTS